MVDSPRDALELFGSAPVDVLAIGPFLVRRPELADDVVPVHPPSSYAVVIPTIGRAGLRRRWSPAWTASPAPAPIVVVDDRRDPPLTLDLPAHPAPLRVVRTDGRGPAAARNAGWRAADADWIAFLDDDVRARARLDADAASTTWPDLPAEVAGITGADLRCRCPEHRRPTDAERRTTAWPGRAWITADMAYRRSALVATGGFDERFPRAFREDADLALRIVRRRLRHCLRAAGHHPPAAPRAVAGAAACGRRPATPTTP